MSHGQTAPRSRRTVLSRVLAVFATAVLLWWFVFYGTPLSHTYDRRTHTVRAVLTTVLVVPMVVAAWRMMDRRPWADLGLASLRTSGRHVLLGMACWAVPAGIGFGLCLGLGWADVVARTSAAEVARVAALLVVLVFLYEALPEELVFRGYIQSNLLVLLRPWQAVGAQAALFTLFGFVLGVAPTIDRLFVFFAFALVLGVFRTATGDIAAGIGFHLAFQTTAQLLLGEGAVFDVAGTTALGVFALGGVPFTLGWMAMIRIYGDRLDWNTPEP
ncbi:CPBP family intramembrane glutamic endopeptidase [Streptomyces flaveus]|uniref:CPBP family intramembrane glutamic endopeptidase n=1 Tax=Streptomyces flaveus TaxID=66370 RepID=UPI00331A3B8C